MKGTKDKTKEINLILSQFKAFGDKRAKKKYQVDENMFQGANIWLIKPNDFNRGRGVVLFNTLHQLQVLLKELT